MVKNWNGVHWILSTQLAPARHYTRQNVDHIEAGIKDEVDNTSSSADCDEISDSVRELGYLVASWCNSSMLDYISVKEQRLREEEEAMDYPDDREYYPPQGGNDSSQMDEMFSSLREEAMNRNKL